MVVKIHKAIACCKQSCFSLVDSQFFCNPRGLVIADEICGDKSVTNRH